MKKEQFREHLDALLPGYGTATAQNWINFSVDCVSRNQYVNFRTEHNQATAVEKWLDTIYAGLYLVVQKFGAEPAIKICNLSGYHTLYPGEMQKAAEYLHRGGSMERVAELSVDGMFVDDDLYFPALRQNRPKRSGKCKEKDDYER